MTEKMNLSKPITELMKQRFSCRSYSETPIDKNIQKRLNQFCAEKTTGPFGTKSRFKLVASQEGDSEALKGLGTYGFIKSASGFIIGVSKETDKHLEDFGYLMEEIILFATDLGLGTCWLGGTFTRSSFAERVSPQDGEIIPAVTATGNIGGKPRKFDERIRKAAGSDHRLPWDQLFFDGEVDTPLSQAEAGDYSMPLEMLRIAPSASNKQPWRIFKDQESWHFYLQRTSGYRDNIYIAKLEIADMQRIDMGIAMCHFELATIEIGLEGTWEIKDPLRESPSDGMEYIVSWVQKS